MNRDRTPPHDRYDPRLDVGFEPKDPLDRYLAVGLALSLVASCFAVGSAALIALSKFRLTGM